MTGIKAIETQYAGCRFRSRLEARWGVFFDALGIEWQYEPQGYVIDGRPYLPDFWLPGQRTWVEVKGHDGAVDRELLAQASAPSGLPLSVDPADTRWPLIKLRMLVLGPIPDAPSFHTALVVIAGTELAQQVCTPICYDSRPDGRHSHGFTTIHGATPVDPQGKDLSGWAPEPLRTWGYGFPCDVIHTAYTAARSARFEYRASG